MSDNLGIRPVLGNSTGHGLDRERAAALPGKRRLVEECEAICIWTVQAAFGKKTLMASIREARSFRLPVPGGYFDIWLVDEPHRLPGQIERWSSLEEGNSRLWLLCPRCRRKVAKLYKYRFPHSNARSDLLCRHCHDLRYLSTNSGGNKWYRDIGRPIRRLLRAKDRLLCRRRAPSVQVRLAQIDQSLQSLARQLAPKTSIARARYKPSGLRRAYRDVNLLGL